MRLFIAEKPELAKAIVEGLGGGRRQEGYYVCGEDYVTWCYGHMLQLLEPEEYDERYAKWDMADLPIAPMPWKKKPGKDKKTQLKIILELLKKAAIVVNAGDPDEEGQLLVDEILTYAHCQLPVKRLLINDNNIKVVKKALANLRDNQEFVGLSLAAEARSVGDQFYGYNLTRAYTLAARNAGYNGVLSVGRVQTPILGLVVRRCRAFKAHQKTYYYLVKAQFKIQEVEFAAFYQIKAGDPVDEKNRLLDAAFAENMAQGVSSKPAVIVELKTQNKAQPAPLPYNLLKLQTDAARKFGLKPDVVKDITQTLREKYKLITYNRSDCEYLSEEQHADANGVLQAISKTAPLLTSFADGADASYKSRAFNSAKVSAHHAIVPTEATADWSLLTRDEQNIYALIARAYIAQFWPPHQYDHTEVILEVAGERFAVSSNITTHIGWRALYQEDPTENEPNNAQENDSDGIDLRGLSTGVEGLCLRASALQKETKPPPLYTMATLLMDLTRVAKYIRDERLRKLLQEKDQHKEGEHGGIGTPATRDSIIATLFHRGYLAEKQKAIIATEAGEAFYDALPEQAKYPDMTALWHEQQKAIRAGTMDIQTFIHELIAYIGKEVENIKQYGLSMKVDAPLCPRCQKALRRIKGSNGYFWGCSGYAQGCQFRCADKAGKPLTEKTTPTVSAEHRCLACAKGLVRRTGKKKGSYWWGCSGYPSCRQTYFDVKGHPDYRANSSGGESVP